VNVRVVDGDLRISGGSDGMGMLARNLSSYLELNELDEPGMHLHLEYYGPPTPHPWLAADALPLVVAGWVSDAPSV